MNSARFEFRIPFQSKAYTWLKNLQDSKENVSRALRLLIETHSDLFDKLTIEQNRVIALKRQIESLKNQGNSQYQAKFIAEADKLARIKKADRAR